MTQTVFFADVDGHKTGVDNHFWFAGHFGKKLVCLCQYNDQNFKFYPNRERIDISNSFFKIKIIYFKFLCKH
jgi:hypothetical protein